MERITPRRFLFRFQDRQASLLVLAVWILVFFSILSLGVYKLVSTRLNLARLIEEKTICPYLAKAAYAYALAEKKDDKDKFISLYKEKKPREKQLGNAKFIYTEGVEEDKININTVATEVLARLPGLNPELAKKIHDSSLKPFLAKEELLLVDGVTSEIYAGLKGLVTVYGSGSVNINTAPAEVLTVLGMEDALVKNIEAFRNGPDGTAGTEDDNFFETTAEIVDKLRAATAFSGAEEAQLVSLISQGLLSVSANDLVLIIQTEIFRKPAMRYEISIDTTKNQIVSWREY